MVCEPNPASTEGAEAEAAAAAEQAEQAEQEWAGEEAGEQHGEEEGKHVPLTADEICERPKTWCDYAGAASCS